MLMLMLMLMLMPMLMSVLMLVSVLVFVAVPRFMPMFVRMRMGVAVNVGAGIMSMLRKTAMVGEMHVELGAGDARFMSVRRVQMISVQMQFAQFAFEPVKIHPQIYQCADKHIAANSAEQIQI